ncbi:hypothetical protein DQ384_09270 [Sphaerisporangium album]|uniref:Uncharacterized protein n=1 Tax=Sphaerisporangium album TaxID=509200 RepID=A0A367FPH3_9ACTN|nr:hypothetical protein [Sphaerisporangium album]RCG31722.1 hypothetical protein DQ384_09270 [Sphaerisporangium album]
MVDVTLDDSDGSTVVVKLQTETWELNIRAPLADLARLHDIRQADWASRRSLAVGTCAGSPVFWTANEDQATILIGHDDETWDIGISLPIETVDEIVRLAGERI